MSFQYNLSRFLVVAGMSIGLFATHTLAAEQAAHKAGHDHAQSPAKLSLDQGKKWPTDEPLRKGMENIRGLMEKSLHDIHEGKLTVAQYNSLAKAITGEVSAIVSNCKLDPKADAQLHLVIAKIVEGAQAMQGKQSKKRHDGALNVVAILDKYGIYFDHPDWKPFEH